ncbi:MAG TPA: hypothetical protein VD908_21515 [Cytophagales bacterium]|nr:hypothetical protein [Cytophagales bacterium]
MNVFKYFPILLMVGTIALYCTGNYASEASTMKTPMKASSIKVKATALGKDKATALENAEVRAFKSLLFEGVPGTAQSLPLLGEEEEFMSQNQRYYQELIKDKGYKNFIQSLEIEYVKGFMGKKNIELALNVDLEALKKDLKKNKVNSIKL